MQSSRYQPLLANPVSAKPKVPPDPIPLISTINKAPDSQFTLTEVGPLSSSSTTAAVSHPESLAHLEEVQPVKLNAAKVNIHNFIALLQKKRLPQGVEQAQRKP
jgi:hypothetical protein